MKLEVEVDCGKNEGLHNSDDDEVVVFPRGFDANDVSAMDSSQVSQVSSFLRCSICGSSNERRGLGG